MTPAGGTVLVLDDDERVCKSLERFLGSIGFNVQTFCTPERLLAFLPIREPACLLLDLNLGQSDGFRILDTLKGQKSSCPIIVLSAYGDVPGAVRAMHAGAEDFLVKPYDPDELVTALNRAMEKARSNQQSDGGLARLRARAEKLTPRQREVIALAMKGLVNKQIAHKLGIAEITVKMHRSRAMHRLGVHTGAELVHLVTLMGMLPPP